LLEKIFVINVLQVRGGALHALDRAMAHPNFLFFFIFIGIIVYIDMSFTYYPTFRVAEWLRTAPTFLNVLGSNLPSLVFSLY
jgi:hypothetical protein